MSITTKSDLLVVDASFVSITGFVRGSTGKGNFLSGTTELLWTCKLEFFSCVGNIDKPSPRVHTEATGNCGAASGASKRAIAGRFSNIGAFVELIVVGSRSFADAVGAWTRGVGDWTGTKDATGGFMCGTSLRNMGTELLFSSDAR